VRPCTEQQFDSHDGARLFYRHWPAEVTEEPRQAVVLFHRGHEHSARLQDVVDQLNLPEFDLFAWDARGHGLSDGARGYAEDFGVLIRDVDGFIRYITQTYGIPPERMAIVAQSVGAVLAAAWVHDYAPRLRALVLASPALRVRLYVPFAIPGLRMLLRFKPVCFITSYVKGKLLTHDAARADSYNRDPLVSPRIAVNILVGLHDAASRLMADAQAIPVPVQFLISGSDWVVKQPPQHQCFERWGATIKEKHVFPGFLHDTLNERDGHRAVALARAFILDRFAETIFWPDLQKADQAGYTRKEYDALSQPLPAWHPKAIFYGLFQLYMRSIGRYFSRGMRVGVETGFDSGSSLDYVYRNQAQGRTLLGRLMDRAYLDSAGWRGIRIRKQHMEQALAVAFGRLIAAGQPIQILDIAAGHGRYVLDTLRTLPSSSYEALLRDFSPLNVEQGRALIASYGLSDQVRFEQGDAFDGETLAVLYPKPTLAIVSGLYELFPENGPVMASLSGLAQAIPSGGYLLYTNQPWHPQLELIARGLTSHRGGKPWVMRRRTQWEMDQLVDAAGFEKIEQCIDGWGMFSVSLARKR
jgi:alpha-beta hydrolase superfamily lysophospholipase